MMRPRVAFAMSADQTKYLFDASLMERLAQNCEIVAEVPLSTFDGARALDILRTTNILITGWGCETITSRVLEATPDLRLIVHAAGTVKSMIDPAVFAAGIAVSHAAEANAVPVAEFTLASILFANKRVFDLRDRYRADPTRQSSHQVMNQPIGNYHRVIGLVGASRIGRMVARHLEAFDFTVLLRDPFVRPDDPIAQSVELVDLDSLMARSDVVSLHAPLLPSTKSMIGRRELKLMKDGATLINTARGGLIDEPALIAELQTRRIFAVIDVTDPEIPEPHSPLFSLPNVFLTPHLAGAVGTERLRLGLMAIEEAERFAAGQSLKYAIDPGLLERMA